MTRFEGKDGAHIQAGAVPEIMNAIHWKYFTDRIAAD